MIDPVSGNQVPLGAMPNEVRDDVPIAASEGEYVLPADVVRYLGLDKIEKMVNQAKEGIARMAEGGRIGGEPTPPPPPTEAIAPPPPDSMTMMNKGGMVRRGYNTGGAVSRFNVDEPTLRSALSPMPFGTSNFARQGSGATQMVEYMDASGRIMFIPTRDGVPLLPVPEGFTERAGRAVPGQQPEGEEQRGVADVAQQAPRTFDDMLRDAASIGVERPAIEQALMQGLGALGPTGMLAARAVEYFREQNNTRVQNSLRQGLETGLGPNGQPLTREQMQAAAAELSRITGTPVQAPRPPSATTPAPAANAPVGLSVSPARGVPGEITTSTLPSLAPPPSGARGEQRVNPNAGPVHDYTRDPGFTPVARSSAPPARPFSEPVHDYTRDSNFNPGPFSETSQQVMGPSSAAGTRASAAPPSRDSARAAPSGVSRDGHTTSGQWAGLNKGGLVSQERPVFPKYSMAKGGLVKPRNK